MLKYFEKEMHCMKMILKSKIIVHYYYHFF